MMSSNLLFSRNKLDHNSSWKSFNFQFFSELPIKFVGITQILLFFRRKKMHQSLHRFIFIFIIGVTFSGCATKEETATHVMLTPVYVIMGISGLIAAPFLHDPFKGKSEDELLSEYGKPIAKYNCGHFKAWEYKKRLSLSSIRFAVFYNFNWDEYAHGMRSVSFLDECDLVEGSPSEETKQGWIIHTYPCGGNFIKQMSKTGKFNIDMKVNQGSFTIDQWRQRFRDYNAEYEISYADKVIYAPPASKKRRGENFIETIQFGPGESTLVHIRVTRNLFRSDSKSTRYGLKISCTH